MSNQFYDYLSNKLLDYFKENKILNGERFFISLDEDEQVMSFYESLKKIGNSKLACSDFSYTHKKSNEKYDTFAIKINDIDLVVSESLSINVDYLVTLRNQVASQQGDWENTALLVICIEGIDSINKGMRDLQKEGMPLSIKSISDKLDEEINHSKLNPADQQITKFSLKILEDDLFQTTFWDYETILSIINKGYIDDEDLIEFNLFKDEQLDSYPPSVRDKRLKENYETFIEVKKVLQYDDKKEKLEKMFSSAGVSRLSRDDWYAADWKSVKKYKDDYINQQKPLNYIENTEKISENGLIYWERPDSFTKTGKRKRNIIVFNTNLSSEVSLKFTFDQNLNNDYVGKRSKNITNARGKSLSVKFDVNQNEPTFKFIRYTHKNESSSDFTFRIAVLNVKPEIIDTIKSRYVINASNKKIKIINEEYSPEIEFGLNSFTNKTEKFIQEEDEKVYLYDDESIIISEQSPAWENGELTFILDYHNNIIPFLVKEKDKKSRPVKSYVLWNLKRKNMDNFIYNGVKVIQDVNSFNLMDEFKDFLKMEREIIQNEIFYAKRDIDGSLRKINISLSEDLENAYLDIIKYYQTFDDSPEDNLPSLVYLNDELKELYRKFLEVFNNEISEIEEGSILADFKNKKDLIKLGRVETDTKIMYSPLSPLNIAYQLEISNQCKNEDLPVNMIKRLVPNNLVPYISSDDGRKLFRPIYQEEAHEWLIYEKTEEVSIGTTNIFISNVVTEKLNQFVKHFNYLFSFNNSSPIKINLINIQDDREVVKGIFNFIRERLPDNTRTKKVIPVEINIYNDAEKSYFDNLFNCQSENQLLEEFGIKNLKTDVFDAIDIIHMIQNNISYYKHPLKKEEYEYAHLSFYKVKSHIDTANDNMKNIDTGLSLNGLLSSVTSTIKHSEYRTGFGTKNILNKKNPLIQTVINLNELVENSRNFGKNKYQKDTSLVTTVELEEDNIDELYEKSHWVTFIEPTFGIEYFENDDELIIIHFSDQYSSSNKYDTITVTNKSTQYEEIIKDFLYSKNIKVSDNELYDIIKLFNSINGEWLLRVISNSGQYDREKLSIISTIKYCLAILDHDDIVWIPVSMEEILRIAKNIKLDKNNGPFDSNLIKGDHIDDLIFVGVKFNEHNKIEIIFYPIEVKIGLNPSSTIKKGKNQLDNTYKLLKTQLQKINLEDSEFKNKFFRNFFIQILLSNEQKLVTNHIWDDKCLNKIENFKAELLNDEFDVSYGLEKYIGIGSLVSFKKDSHHISINMDTNKQVIELPEYYAYYGLATPIENIHHEIQSDNTDIPAETLLSNMDINANEEEPVATTGNRDGENTDSDSNTESETTGNSEGNNTGSDTESETTGNSEGNNTGSDTESETTGNSEGNNTGSSLTAGGEYSSDISNIRALIGTQKGHSHKIYWEFGHRSLANRHMLIQGKSGQGKTYFIQRMLKELSNQGVPSIIIDYTDGFKKSKLEDKFKEALGDRIDQHLVLINKFPLNPFKKNLIELDDEFYPENNVSVAGRFKSVVNSVYNFGDQQLNTIYNAVLRGLNKYGEDMDLSILKEELLGEDTSTASSVLNKLSELLDINPFESNKFDWSNVLDGGDGKVLIIQLTGLSKDIQKVISELVLWDLWYYKASSGREDKPFIVVLDEAHNLDFGSDSPCSKILTEGRKFGWSGWFATQSIKGTMKPDEIAKLANAEEKIYFHPTDISSISKELSKNNEDRKKYEKELSQLNKGHCIVQGTTLNSEGELYHPDPLIVKIDEITGEKYTGENNNFSSLSLLELIEGYPTTDERFRKYDDELNINEKEIFDAFRR